MEVDRALAPGAAGVHGDALVVDGRGRVHAHGEVRQIRHREPAAFAANEGHHFRGDVALVEAVAGGADGGLPALPGGGAFGVNQPPEGLGQVGLNQQFAGVQGFAAGVENPHCAGPAAGVAFVQDDVVAAVDQGAVECGGDGEAGGGEFQGRRDHLFKGHCAVAFQGGQPGVGGGGGDGAHHAVGQIAALFLVEVVDGGFGGPASQAADFAGFAGGGVVDDDGGHAAEAGVLGQGDVDGDAGGHAGVNGVAALFQDAVAGGRGQVVARADHMRNATHQGPVGTQSDAHNDLRSESAPKVFCPQAGCGAV